MLTIHRAERADRLVEALAAIIADPPDDPFTPAVVSVPTRGIERWLTQRLSTTLGASPDPDRHDGVCANVEFPFPGRLIGGALALASGTDPSADPWLPERLVWPLLGVVEDHHDEPWMAALAAHLGAGAPDAAEVRDTRRFGAVRHLADLFDHYGVHRPEMVVAWAAGDDTDGRGQQLPPDLAWQAELWRRLRARVGTSSPAERLEPACARLRAEPDLLDLPTRVELFGLTRLAAMHVAVLHALGAARDVHLFLLHPSPVLWDRVAAASPHGGTSKRALRADDPTAALPRHPLLATWGRDAREMQLVLDAAEPATTTGTRTDLHHPLDASTDTLLRQLQTAIRADETPPGPPVTGEPDRRAVLDPTDRSLQVHACHGRTRQVEVLRDAILHLLADDPTLEPRDVVVMCPDIEAYAPLIHAAFGASASGVAVDGSDGAHPDGAHPDGAHPDGAHADGAHADGAHTDGPDGLPDLHVRLADRALRQTNPLLGFVTELLDLADARLTASQVVDLAGREPVRRRFRLDDDDLERIEAWIAATGVRWGLDAAHRAPYELDALATNTWSAGLDRLLLGVAMAEDDLRLVGGVLPLDDVDSGDIDLAGRLAELVDRLGAAVSELSQPQPVAAWTHAIARAVDNLTRTPERDAWQRLELERVLSDVRDEVAAGAADAERGPVIHLALPEVRSLLARRLQGRPTRANFRTGHLTVCTLVPMRSVPHRVVCLLGLDDGVFPRRAAPDGDDITERGPCVGDRDPRSEDRQLLLDALLAATGHLVITYSGRDERTNAVLPPAVPVGELLDVVDRTVRTPDGEPARSCVVVHHPLQTFDLRNFVRAALVPSWSWSFDPTALAGARAAAGDRRPRPSFLAGPLPPATSDVIELDDLVRFVRHPVRAFLRQRLGIYVTDGEEEPADGLPLEFDSLEKWAVGDRMLERLLGGVELEACTAAEVARGTLPPGVFGRRILEDIAPTVEDIVVAANTAVEPGATAESLEVNVDLSDGRVLVGTVPVLGDTIRTVIYSRVAAKQRLVTWVRFLAAVATHPRRELTAVTIGRGTRGAGHARLPLLGTDATQRRRNALAHLHGLVDLYDRGMCEPLPLYCATSAAYAAAKPAARVHKARDEWQSGQWTKEDGDPVHQLVLGGIVPFGSLLLAEPADGERGLGWDEGETTRFGRLAIRLWSGLLRVETRTNL
jgi:exodeoxyribonuclease V gamma subunit